jgi:hypothetical protein
MLLQIWYEQYDTTSFLQLVITWQMYKRTTSKQAAAIIIIIILLFCTFSAQMDMFLCAPALCPCVLVTDTYFSGPHSCQQRASVCEKHFYGRHKAVRCGGCDTRLHCMLEN